MNNKIYELYKKEIFLTQEELNEFKRKYINEENKICGKDTLKGNLRDNISYSNIEKDKNYYYYFFKMSEEKYTAIKVNKKFSEEIEKNSEDNKIKAFVFIELDSKKLTKKEIESLFNKRDVYKSSQGNPDLLFGISHGELVKLQNKDEILIKGKLSKPLKTNFIEYKKSTSFDYEGTKEGASMAVVWGGVAILMIPLAIITLPFQAVDSLSK